MKLNISKFNPTVTVVAGGLSLLGMLSLYSSQLAEQDFGIFWKYFVMGGAGILFWIFFSVTDYHAFTKSSKWIYLASVLLLLATLLFGTTVRGSQRWLGVGDLRFQTSELAKLAVVLGLSRWLYTERGRINTPNLLLRTAFFTFIPAGLVMVQPDLGSALTILAIWGGLLIVSRARLSVLAIIVVLGITSSYLAWHFALHDFQKNRILIFIDPNKDRSGTGYNIRQSIIAVGSGGLWGKGLGHGEQSQLNFLPERKTDFAFAAISEELGLLGAMIVISLYAILLHKTWQIAHASAEQEGTYVALGIWWWLFFQGVVNIGMNIGVMPVTGIPLPFVSYGGSSLLVSSIAVGLLNNIAWQNKHLRF